MPLLKPGQRLAPVKYDLVELSGGLDLITPRLELPPGAVLDSTNFEINTASGSISAAGYSRVAGYERFDGRPAPSDATYIILEVGSFTNVPLVGQTLTGQTSGATGVITVVETFKKFMTVSKIVGVFVVGEVIKVGATTIGTIVTQTVTITSEASAQYLAATADNYRADIGAVPGSGPVRGVFTLIVSGVDNTYAFRDNVAATNVDLYKSSSAGWVLVPYFNEVSFTVGNGGPPLDGQTLTQGAVTATIQRVMLQSGSWSGGTAAGRLIITNPTGGNFVAGAATIGAVTLTLSGAQTAITMTPGGKFQFDIGNFFGQAGTIRIYGCDNANRGFEFDGTTFSPITTGFSPDTPKYVSVHRSHLFFAFKSSLGCSGTGTPYNWTALAGAAEFAVGDTITDVIELPGSQDKGSFAVWTKSSTQILYGTDTAGTNPFTLVPYNEQVGAIDYTAQNLLYTYTLYNSGITDLQTTLKFGSFAQSTLTVNIFPFIQSARSRVANSVLCRAKSQYRIFFTDKQALFQTIVNGKNKGSMLMSFPNEVFSTWNGVRQNGDEVIFFGDKSTGYVYQMEKGSSFDGGDINARFALNWNHQKSPRMLKRYRKGAAEIQGSNFAAFTFGYLLGYGKTEIIQPTPAVLPQQLLSAPLWDQMVWDAFTWDGANLVPAEIEINGTAENIQCVFSSGTNYMYPYTINSLILHYSFRRGLR